MLKEAEKNELTLRSAYNTRSLIFSRIFFLGQFALSVLVLILIVSSGCNDSGVIGLDVQPSSDLIKGKFSDTTTLVAYTVAADSLRSDEPILGLLGAYVDPVFGQSTASFYLNFSTPTNNLNFGDGFTPDSLVMTIAYVGYYGEAPTTQTIMVYRLTEEIYDDSAYYSSNNIPMDYSVDLGGGATINPSDADLTVSIKLNDPVFTSSDSSFDNNAVFQSFLKGFYVVTNFMDPEGLLYLDINSSLTKLTLYYNDSMSFDFKIDGESAWFNRFHHSYAGTPIEPQFTDPSLGDSLVYVQPNGGLRVKLEMPYLNKWIENGKIAINKAELVLSVYDDGTLGTYEVPVNLFILGAGDNTVITDQYEGASFFGGTYNAADKTYSFNIARYVHELLYEGRPNDGIYIIVPNNLLTSGSVVSANRVVLGGPGHSQLGMKLNLIYTEL